MKKIYIAFISMCLIFSLTLFADAAKISYAKQNEKGISVKISGISKKPSQSDIKAFLDSEPLNVKNISYKAQSIEWIVMLDKSKSVHEDYFEAEKDALCTLYAQKRTDDILRVYTFDSEINEIIDSTESVEEAKEKIGSIPYNGTETVFYDAVKAVSDLCKESKAKFCIPVLFTDGVDTESDVTRKQAKTMLSGNGFPVYALYPDDIKSSEMESLSALMKLSGGYAKPFSLTNLAEQFGKLKKMSGTLSVVFDIPDNIEGNGKHSLNISVFDSKSVKTTVTVQSAAQPETTESETQTDIISEPIGSTEVFPIWLPIAGGAILLAAVITLVVLKKKKKPAAIITTPKKTDSLAKEAVKENENDTKPTKQKKEKQKQEQKFKFYFVDKK